MATTSPTGTPAPVQAGVMVSIDAHIQERIHAAIQELRAEFDERLRKLEEQRDTPAPPEKGAEPDDVQYIAGTRIPAEIASRGPTTVPTSPSRSHLKPHQVWMHRPKPIASSRSSPWVQARPAFRALLTRPAH
jgi:hypothetical protein